VIVRQGIGRGPERCQVGKRGRRADAISALANTTLQKHDFCLKSIKGRKKLKGGCPPGNENGKFGFEGGGARWVAVSSRSLSCLLVNVSGRGVSSARRRERAKHKNHSDDMKGMVVSG